MINIFITGSSGFIGNNLVNYLSLNHTYKLFLINRRQIKNKNKNINNFYYKGKINTLINFFKRNKPDIIIHLATNFISDHNENQISDLLGSNILFGTEILEAMSHTRCKNIINFGTYWQKYKTYDYNPVNLYSATKEAFEKILKFYFETHQIKNLTLMLSDTFGINDKRKKLIDTLVKSSISGQEINLTDGKQILDLIYIDTIIDNIEHAINFLISSKKNISSVYFLTGHRYSIKKIVKKIEILGNKKINANFGMYEYKNRTIMKPIKIKVQMKPPWFKKIKTNNFDTNIKKIISFYEKK